MYDTYRWFKLSHHRHTGRLRPHEYTSYGPLFLLLLMVGVALTYCTAFASPGPAADSVGLTGTMPGKPPTTAAVITSPTNGQHITQSPTTIKGTCPPKTLVEIYKNDIFAGSGACSDSGNFSFDVDLLIGKNDLVARVYDALNQAGPDSATVTVFYDALPPQAAPLENLIFGGPQMLLNTDAVFRGSFPGQQMNMPLTIIGGVPPYAVNVQWGDNSNKVIPRNDNLTFNVGHVYKKAGTFQVSLQATDSQGRVAFLTVAAIINGQPTAVAQGGSTPKTNKFLMLWPLYVSAVAIAVAFWLGEKREKRILAHQPIAIQYR